MSNLEQEARNLHAAIYNAMLKGNWTYSKAANSEYARMWRIYHKTIIRIIRRKGK